MERDVSAVSGIWSVVNFNSHAHVERDKVDESGNVVANISTHTLTWSVTKFETDTDTAYTISTHTLTWSVTHL